MNGFDGRLRQLEAALSGRTRPEIWLLSDDELAAIASGGRVAKASALSDDDLLRVLLARLTDAEVEAILALPDDAIARGELGEAGPAVDRFLALGGRRLLKGK